MTTSSSTVPSYNDDIVKLFTIGTLTWAVLGMGMGLFIAFQLAFPHLNFEPYFNFGRIRPVHTTGVVFGFAGNILFATSFFVVQRTCRVRLWGGDKLAKFLFWGYQAFVIMAVTGYVQGINQSKEYAEPEWYADLWLAVIWITYLIVFMMTLKNRTEPHIYVANWFYLAFIITVAILHIVNGLAVPVSLHSTKSYAATSGVQSAMIQWWYGHNMIGFFLTAGFLAIMYYYVPKQAQRPVYSYRLSIIHFWSLIFLYIWVGSHHLLFSALPDWVQTLGMTFSIMLWMPSWGGMINGMMTLNGAWHKLREDPVLQFLIISLAFYGMSTFEGPVLAIKEVNALAHYTDWIIGHVHSGTLGFVGFMAFGALYNMVPVLWRKQRMYSKQLIQLHLWIATGGIVLYLAAMWIAGITQGLMEREYDSNGFLVHTFVDIVQARWWLYVMRAVGGILYLSGVVIMIYNIWKTVNDKSVPAVASKGVAA